MDNILLVAIFIVGLFMLSKPEFKSKIKSKVEKACNYVTD